MWVADFDFELPAERIAQRALPRGESRLLVLDAAGEQRHRAIRDLPALLRAGDLLVVNDTRVIPARLFGRRVPGPHAAAGEGGGRVELLLIERAAGPARQDEVGSGESWRCLVKPGRRAKPGTRLQLEMAADGSPSAIAAEVIAATASGQRLVHFSEPLAPHLDTLGHVPLPPYIQRTDTPEDQWRYQTLFASKPGAIAAPTAGLHFDQSTLAALAERGIERATVTLHVGIGTFKPVTAALVHEHRMDAERYEVPAATAEAIAATRRRGGRVVAVGTTVVRTLETAALVGSGSGGSGTGGSGSVQPGAGSSELFITPGFPFQAVDGLLTNFHLPRSTLLMLVSAFAGRDRVLAAYREAIDRQYRFYSYGDAMFSWRRS